MEPRERKIAWWIEIVLLAGAAIAALLISASEM